MGPPPLSPAISYWDLFPKRQQLFDARKRPNETLSHWVTRITKLGENAEYKNAVLLDMVLRDRFVTGLDPGPLKDFLQITDNTAYTFKQILDLAFIASSQFEMEAKAKAKAQAELESTIFSDSD